MTTAVESGVPQRDIRQESAPYATVGVAVVAGVAAVALLLTIGRYGFFGDELYFISAGRRLTVGYADQGPAVPAIARLMDLLAPGSLVAQRLPGVLLTVVAIAVTAQIAREFGGSRRAQVLAALGYAVAPFLLIQGGQLSTNVVDIALWVVISWLIVRWVRTRRDVLLLWAGAVTALDMQVKWLIPFFWVALAVGVLAFGPRELLRRPALWWGAALVVVTMVPSLIWQAGHGWPQLAMGAQVSAEMGGDGGRLLFVPMALYAAGGWGLLLLCVGLWALLRAEALRPYRFLGVVPLVLMVAFVVTNGRPYYVMGCYPVVMAAGAVWWARAVMPRWRMIVAVVTIASSVPFVVLGLPVTPEQDLKPAASEPDSAAMFVNGKFGWSDLAQGAAAAYAALPEARRAHAVIVTNSYWQAAALDNDRDRYGLPAVYSPNRGFGYFGAPPDSAITVLWVGGRESDLRSRFATVTPIGRVDARLGYPGVTRDVTIWRCDDPRRPWSQAWAGMRRL
ncbi:ArnT family glycosyltransferase [Nocardia terpenica]|uniref:Glycosyl transferase family 39 n=1 Tax=Nocardia terpenica TaxID=455432 RepID=A0A164M590_9NOCA|nr:glycosyltransferase family 39 protein [Nocardia terpenica]KZM73050.1 glycosyl transferase family 39 [Nocardia terpenica]NQE91998.1 glycosyltransferase family 39 protein [Nocardia terpenica]